MTDKSTEDLIRNVSEQVGTLVRKELRLALQEVRTKASQAGLASTMVAFAGVLALYAGAAVVAGMILFVAKPLPPWLAAISTGFALTFVAAVIGLVGQKQLRAALVPEQALADTEAALGTATETSHTRTTEP